MDFNDLMKVNQLAEESHSGKKVIESVAPV